MKVGLIAVAATVVMLYYEKEIVEAVRGKRIPAPEAKQAQLENTERPVFKAMEEERNVTITPTIIGVQTVQKGRSEQEKEMAWSAFYKKSKHCEQQDDSTSTMVKCGNEFSRERAKFEKQWTEEQR